MVQLVNKKLDYFALFLDHVVMVTLNEISARIMRGVNSEEPSYQLGTILWENLIRKADTGLDWINMGRDKHFMPFLGIIVKSRISALWKFLKFILY